jgi:hypothetical protein
MAVPDKRIQDLNVLQERLYKRLQDVEARIKKLERSGGVSAGLGVPLVGKATVIDQAAWELEDAIFDHVDAMGGSYMSNEKIPTDIVTARAHHVQLLHANNYYVYAIIGLIALTFLEVPPWCHAKHKNIDLWTFQSGESWCPLPTPENKYDANPNLSGVWYLPPGYAFIIELFIELFILYKFYCELRLERDHFWPIDVYMRSKFIKFGFVMAVGSIIDTAVFMFFRVPFRLTWFFRTGLIVLLPGVFHILKSVFGSAYVMYQFASVGIFFLGTIVFFAWMGWTVFKQAGNLSYYEGEEKVVAGKGFETFPSSVNTMFIGGVTGEFIDQFLPSFNAFRVSGFVWMIYLLLTQVLFKNLVMDTLIEAYLKGKESEEKSWREAQVKGMLKAFDLLSNGGESIIRDDFVEFAVTLRNSPRWAPMPKEVAEMIYDKFEEINKENFVNACCLLQYEFHITERHSPLKVPEKSSAGKALYEAVWGDPKNPDNQPLVERI